MMRRWMWVLGFLCLSAAVGGAQTYGPGEIYYGGIRLQFSGRLLTAGTCTGPVQPGPGVSEVRCQVVEGSAGTVELTAVRTPAGAVNLRVESVPSGWSSSLWVQQLGQWVDSRSSVASGWGTVTAQYRFTVPTGSAGRSFTLRFKAWTLGVIGELELRVVLEAVRAVTPPPTEPTVPPSYGPFTGTTDAAGRFTVPIPTLPNTAVTGTLTECTVRPLPGAQVSVTLVPKAGVAAISRTDQIGVVRVSSPGYGEVEVTQLQLLSSMDMFGRVSTTVGAGTVCLRPTALPVTPPPTSIYGPITGKTDAEGKFTATLAPGVTVSGRLTECTVKPLPNQEFTLTPLPKGETIVDPVDIAGFKVSASGYQEATVTRFSWLSLFGIAVYELGPVCLMHVGCPTTRLRVLTWNTHLLPSVAKFVDERIPEVARAAAADYDIVCLQEVFAETGKEEIYKAWTGQKTPGKWHPLTRNQDTLIEIEGRNILLRGAMPNDEGTEVYVGRVGDRYVLAGPDSYCPVTIPLVGTADVETTQDGGLMLLSKHRVVQAGAMIWKDQAGLLGGEELSAKGALYARIQLDPNKADCYIHVFNVHLAARDPEFTGPKGGQVPHPDNAWEARQSQLIELVAFIKACTKGDGHPIILCGDFNVVAPFPANWGAELLIPPGVNPGVALPSPQYEKMFELLSGAGLFTDAWREKHPDKPGFTWLGNDWRTRKESPWGDKGNPLAKHGGWPQRLDYVLYARGGDLSPLTLRLEAIKPTRWSDRIDAGRPFSWKETSTYVPSDHLGLIAEFTVSPP